MMKNMNDHFVEIEFRQGLRGNIFEEGVTATALFKLSIDFPKSTFYSSEL